MDRGSRPSLAPHKQSHTHPIPIRSVGGVVRFESREYGAYVPTNHRWFLPRAGMEQYVEANV